MPVAAAAAAEATDGALIGKAFAKPLGALKAQFWRRALRLDLNGDGVVREDEMEAVLKKVIPAAGL